MTGEEMERAIDFLLKSQANLEARIEEVDQRLGARIEEVNRILSAQVEKTNRQLAETNRQLGEYASMQTMLIQVVTRTFESQAVINQRTDEKLNVLIDTVNRMLSGGQGSNP
jgi:vacuolar-type H+-ATPase subunit I/STV1